MAALQFPLSLAQFLDQLPIGQLTLVLVKPVEHTETSSGEVLSVDYGDAYWEGTLTFGQCSSAAADVASTLVDRVIGASGSFRIGRAHTQGPTNDPGGSTVSAWTTAHITAADSSRRVVTVAGVTSFTLEVGDLMEVEGDSTHPPTLHRVVQRKSSASGSFTGLEVDPPLPAWWNAGGGLDSVNFMNPSCKAKIIPGSWSPPNTLPGNASSGGMFKWRQTSR